MIDLLQWNVGINIGVHCSQVQYKYSTVSDLSEQISFRFTLDICSFMVNGPGGAGSCQVQCRVMSVFFVLYRLEFE